jgi:O-antigen/teichoic acid export membrane protein
MISRDLAVIVGQRLWQALAGMVTILFVVRFLSADEQGWYYTFVSVAALYSLFEMGLAAAVIQTSAHFFVHLQWLPQGGVRGDASSAFESFVSSSARMYFRVAGMFVVAALILGGTYFSAKAASYSGSSSWIYPWVIVVLATAANMLTLPLFAIVEGSGALTEVYGVRLLQGIGGSLICWMILASGGSLWAAAAMPAMGAAVATVWLLRRRRLLGTMARKSPVAADFDWRTEVWPLQWRIGMGWVSVFLMSQLSTPILFYFQDPVVAGQMGLSLTIAHMLGILAQSTFAKSVVPMSRAVAQKDWTGLSRIFRRSLAALVSFFGFGALVVWLGYQVFAQSPYIHRLLPIEQMAGLLAFVLFYQLNGAFASHIRAFRREPLAWISAVGAALIVVGSLAVATHYSSSGVIVVMVATQLLVVFPLSFWIWRQNIERCGEQRDEVI